MRGFLMPLQFPPTRVALLALAPFLLWTCGDGPTTSDPTPPPSNGPNGQEPSIAFATFFGADNRGGSQFSGGAHFREAKLGPDGDIVVTGHGPGIGGEFPNEKTRVFGSLGDQDIYVAKFSPDGSEMRWVALIGGSGKDRGYGLALDESGDIYVAGQTGPNSAGSFPVTSGAWDRTFNGGSKDAHVLKLSSDGSQLIYATYLGGTDDDVARGGLALDSSGSAYVVGATFSPDFLDEGGVANPAKVNAFHGGLSDGFVAKVAPNGSSVEYARYVGGSDDQPLGDGIVGARVGSGGSLYFAGLMRASDVETTATAFDPTFNGGSGDLYVGRLSADGRELLFGTYIGGGGDEGPELRLALDAEENVYVAGATNSPDFPTVGGQDDHSGGFDGYLLKLDPGGQLLFSTLIGGAGDESAFGPALDAAGNMFVAGPTESSQLEVTSDAISSTHAGGDDGYVRAYSPSGELLFSTFFGGSGDEVPRFVTLDGNGAPIVVGGTANSPEFPVTEGAWDTDYNGGADAFVMKLVIPQTQ